eukprot:CAMPEP_0119004142 /NCGR_PEP_ID=MMETSP1176-20130426/977_1 /TAXON_ID=265551 /ORGANISM="Synedropsis recta cf, Strain CCMP1620" /LENGTH=615 /DNA_ID=CAMNT_0006955819 /DNA_START=209 /DNA_END=2056 /DNA_ORIENTATION=+
MRASSLILLFTCGAIGAVLLGTVILEHGMFRWLLEENELPVQLNRKKLPPGFLFKCLIWIQLFLIQPKSNEDQCKVYMAESTIPKSGMGIYTATDLGERALVGASEIVIPITFPRHVKGLWKVWNWYVWEPNIPKIDAELNTHAAFIPGIGSTLNSHFWDLTNLYVVGQAQYDTAQLHRTADVGAGGFTPYHKVATHTHRSITAGSELFSFYGDSFFHSPLRYDMHATALTEADAMLIDFNGFVNTHPDMTNDLKEAIWKELIQEFPISDIQSGYEGVQALPQRTWAELRADSSLSDSPSWSRDVQRQKHHHSPEWLRENGFCMDWIEEGQSTVQQAGRGAFARRFIPKGTRIALAPLVHIADKEAADGWNHEHVKQELVRNYSFGHKDTSLLLTPHGAGVGLINHASSGANVIIQWPTELLPCHDPAYLGLPISALGNEKKPRLSLEYTVTRNVYPGEELFLNYGQEWEAAWERHIRKWRPQTEWFVHPSQVNKNERIRTVQELGYDPYAPNLYLRCVASYAPDENGNYIYVPTPDTVDSVPCVVISRNDWVYRVELTDSGIVMEQVPHSAIVFETHTATSDWALPNAFRHEMVLPDALVPDVWKNTLPTTSVS